MAEMRVLLSFVGNRDPYPETEEEYGPLLSLLQVRQYDQAYPFCAGSQYLERARMVAEAAGNLQKGCRFHFITIELDSPIDYVEILSKLKAKVAQVVGKLSGRRCTYSVLLEIQPTLLRVLEKNPHPRGGRPGGDGGCAYPDRHQPGPVEANHRRGDALPAGVPLAGRRAGASKLGQFDVRNGQLRYHQRRAAAPGGAGSLQPRTGGAGDLVEE